MFRPLLAAAMLTACPIAGTADSFAQTFPGHPGYTVPGLMEILRDLQYRRGRIALPGGRVVLEVPDEFYYLDPQDTETVLTQLWGNPEGSTLGMIFPGGWTPWDEEAWGAELTWEPIGHVAHVDLAVVDLGDLMRRMQADTATESEARVDAGYESVELIGWAEPPSYDAESRVLHWALELSFGNTSERTLNYRLRALGRVGTLSANFIGTLGQLDQIRTDLPAVRRMIAFTEGHRHADFDPETDRRADLDLDGLIAASAP